MPSSSSFAEDLVLAAVIYGLQIVRWMHRTVQLLITSTEAMLVIDACLQKKIEFVSKLGEAIVRVVFAMDAVALDYPRSSFDSKAIF